MQSYFDIIYDNAVNFLDNAQDEYEEDNDSDAVCDVAQGLVCALSYFLTTRDDPEFVLKDVIEDLQRAVKQEMEDRRRSLN